MARLRGGESTAGFWLKLTGVALLIACLVIIYLGDSLFGQSTRLTHAGRDLAYAEAQRDALAALLGELAPAVPLAEAQAAAERAGLKWRVDGEPPEQRLVIEGLFFDVRDGIVGFRRD